MTLIPVPHSRPWITLEDVTSVANFVKFGMISTGQTAERFRELILDFVGSADGVLTRSGSQAIAIGLLSIGVRKGDEVIIPTYVCKNVLDAVVYIGATPIICDTNQNGLIDFENASRRITQKVKAIVAVHTFGFRCEIETLRTLGVPILEDACQAFGFKFGDKIAGTFGDVGVFSFHPTKCLTSGEGGMLVSDNLETIRRARDILQHDMFGFNNGSIISDINAALGISQLARYSTFLDRRSLIKKLYNDSLSSGLTRYPLNTDSNLSFRFVFRTKSGFESVSRYFSQNGVVARRGVDQLLHRTNKTPSLDFQNAENLFQKNISIPYHPSLTDDEVSRICSLLKGISDVDKI
jgi:UDP-4-amino-4-deoxy-L-arabinose-oxoglutarate aminotransferase